MIIGIGIDIVEIKRIEKMLEKHPDSFIDRILTESEKEKLLYRRDTATFLAGRWAAKEAVSKALRCGIGKDCTWKDICVVNDSRGRPEMILSGDAKATAEKLGAQKIHISISHEASYAFAQVILES